MARKKKTSPAEDFIELVALLPWWLGLLGAAASYFLLHRIAVQPVDVTTVRSVDDLTGTIRGSFIHTAALFGQYLAPSICVLGAGLSALRRRRRSALLDGVADAADTQALNAMTWQEFEQMVGEWFRRQGYSPVEVGGGGADGGIDLILYKDGKKFLVQCKQWRSMKVGVSIVREFYGVMTAESATGGFIVTSGTFTDDAQEFARGKNVQLLDGVQLLRALGSRPGTSKSPEENETTVVGQAEQGSSKSCPACASPMTRRIAKRGINAGKEFWGCSGYPSCKCTLPFP